MPRATILTRELVLNAAFELVHWKGLEGLSAQNVARELNCSVRPVYDAFGSMDGLKREVLKRVQEEVDGLISLIASGTIVYNKAKVMQRLERIWENITRRLGR